MDDIGTHGNVIEKIGLLSKVNLSIIQKNKKINFYRSSLPDGYYDKKFEIKDLWKGICFTQVISLISEKEYLRKTGKDEKSNYYFMKKK